MGMNLGYVFLYDNGILCDTLTCSLGKFHLLPVEYEAMFRTSETDVSTAWVIDSSVHYFVAKKLKNNGEVKMIAPGVVRFTTGSYAEFRAFRCAIEQHP